MSKTILNWSEQGFFGLYPNCDILGYIGGNEVEKMTTNKFIRAWRRARRQFVGAVAPLCSYVPAKILAKFHNIEILSTRSC